MKSLQVKKTASLGCDIEGHVIKSIDMKHFEYLCELGKGYYPLLHKIDRTDLSLDLEPFQAYLLSKQS